MMTRWSLILALALATCAWADCTKGTECCTKDADCSGEPHKCLASKQCAIPCHRAVNLLAFKPRAEVLASLGMTEAELGACEAEVEQARKPEDRALRSKYGGRGGMPGMPPGQAKKLGEP